MATIIEVPFPPMLTRHSRAARGVYPENLYSYLHKNLAAELQTAAHAAPFNKGLPRLDVRAPAKS